VRVWPGSKPAAERAAETARKAGKRWTVRQVAAALGVPACYVTRWLQRGWFPAHRPVNSRVVLIRSRVVKRMVEDERVLRAVLQYKAGKREGEEESASGQEDGQGTSRVPSAPAPAKPDEPG